MATRQPLPRAAGATSGSSRGPGFQPSAGPVAGSRGAAPRWHGGRFQPPSVEFLTGKTRCHQVKFRCDCKSGLSQRFFQVNCELRIEKRSLVIEECPRMAPRELSERRRCFAARMGKVVDALPNTPLGRPVPTCRELVRRAGAPALRPMMTRPGSGKAALTSRTRSIWLCKGWRRLEVGSSSSSGRHGCPPDALRPWWNPDLESGLGKSVSPAQAEPKNLRARCGFNDQ